MNAPFEHFVFQEEPSYQCEIPRVRT